jgi:prepilin-type N-terminal cleavage/methylation domain-containing protein
MNRNLKTSQPLTQRRGFTLMELLIAIVIIGILMALLIPTIAGVRRRVQQAAVSTEITQLEQAIASFKSRFGIEPPSSLTVPAAENGWSAEDRQKVLRIWDQFDFSTCGGRNYSGTASSLNGAECLVFFLGGLNSGTTTAPTLIGFSKNPTTPWSTTGENRDAPFFENFAGRLVDVDEDDALEFVDSLPEQKTPYLYLTGQGKNYRKANVADAFDDYDVYDNVADVSVDARDMTKCYLNSDDKTPHRAQSYQLISPGFDGLYGTGGIYTDGSELTAALGRQAEADNITNFSGGVLQK